VGTILIVSIIFVKLMDMIGSAAPPVPVPVPVLEPLPTATGTAAGLARRQRAPRLSPHALLDLVKRSAAQLGPLSALPEPAGSHRWYMLLDRTADFELWVIQWPHDTGLVLHDHGGSAGAFYVTTGVLEETSTNLPGLRLHRRVLAPHQGKSFGPEYVHSVRNPRTMPATSVHGYSPPLTSMTFYKQSSTGLMASRLVTEWEGAP
jgi:Cysteine dioxygenase type I